MSCDAPIALQRAVTQALINDPVITAAIGHAPGNIRIGYGYPDIAGKLPFLGFTIRTRPRNRSFPRLRVSTIEFCICSDDQLTPTQVAGIIECRITGDTNIPAQQVATWFWDISAPGISVKSFIWNSTFDEPPTEKPKRYCTVVVGQIFWLDSSCSGTPLDCSVPL